MNEKGRKNLDTLIQDIQGKGLSTINNVFFKILELIKNPDPKLSEYVDVFNNDLAASAQLIKTINSAYYKPPYKKKEILDIKQAIIRLGNDVCKEILMCSFIAPLFKSGGEIGDYYSIEKVRKGSVVSAIMAKLIYRREFSSDGNYPYLANLLKHIGISIENQFLYDDFKEAVIEKQKNLTDLTKEEDTYLGINHEEVGKEITKMWNFPHKLVCFIGYHNTPNIEDKEYKKLINDGNLNDEEHKKLVYTTRLSELVCHEQKYGYNDHSNGFLEKECKECQKELGINNSALASLEEALIKEIKNLKEAGRFF